MDMDDLESYNSSMGYQPGDLLERVTYESDALNEGFVVPGGIEEDALRQAFADVLSSYEVVVIGLNTGEACGFHPSEICFKGRLDDDR
jgi:hypothetical protein